MAGERRQLALVTGASSGIGLELARLRARGGFDLVIAADEPQVHDAATDSRLGASVESRSRRISRPTEGVDRSGRRGERPSGRRVDRQRRHGLVTRFSIRTSTASAASSTRTSPERLYLVHQSDASCMRERGNRADPDHRIDRRLHAWHVSGGVQRHQGAARLFRSRCARAEGLRVTVTCLMPGATETDFFERADMLDTKVGTEKKQIAGGRADRLRGDDEGRRRRRHWLEQQAPRRHRRTSCRRRSGRASTARRRGRGPPR